MSKISYVKIEDSEELIPIWVDADYVDYNGNNLTYFLNNYEPLELETEINAQSSNAVAASSKAVYDFFNEVIGQIKDGQEVSY